MLSRLAKSIKEYTAGEQPGEGYIKLNTNENPYPPSPLVASAIKAADTSRLKLYPDPECTQLKETLAKLHGLSPENIFVGNGSDEVLAFCFAAFYDNTGEPLLFPDITYSFYPVYAALFGIPYRQIPVREDLTIDMSSYSGGQGIVLANPNAPTSIALSKDEIEQIIKKNPDKPIITDEAYADFSDCSVVELVTKYPNLCVARTFSKSYSLAGLRVGYAAASPELIAGIKKIKNCFNSYTVGLLSQTAAKAALEDAEYHAECVQKIIRTRERVTYILRSEGFTVPESGANFLYITKNGVNMREVYLRLKERKILVRYFGLPRINNYLRVTVGTDAEMDEFVKELLKAENKEVFIPQATAPL